MLKNNKRRNIVRTILSWYKRQGRTLPWRGITNSYRILISEIMLQQTQVSRVLVKYPEFLRRFPTLQSLANAKQRDVVLAWQGMGYNNRAVRLHKFARAVVEEYRGRIPQDFDSLVALPGIGKYTAHALLSSAFGKQLPIVDVNVRRVLSRTLWRMKTTAEMRKANDIWQLAEAILPKGKAYNWNQALMDLGAMVCSARSPKCDMCPVAKLCASRTGMKRKNVVPAKRGPSLGGIPNRMYRGRIVEQLRQVHGAGSIRADALVKAVYPAFSQKDEKWMKKLVADLEKDGLIHVTGNGSLRTSRVSLA